MNLYDQYLSLLQMFFHRQDKKTSVQPIHDNDMPITEEQLFREAA